MLLLLGYYPSATATHRTATWHDQQLLHPLFSPAHAFLHLPFIYLLFFLLFLYMIILPTIIPACTTTPASGPLSFPFLRPPAPTLPRLSFFRSPNFTTARGGAVMESSSSAVSAAGKNINLRHQHRWRNEWDSEKEKLVVIMGATGTGKTKLSIDIAGRFSGEVINSDKIQVYRGLDITTNKISISDRRGVPHHLLGDLDPSAGELSPVGFRFLADAAVSDIAARDKLPVLAGGSNSFIHALVADVYNSSADPFTTTAVPGCRHRYRCCFLWVDVEREILEEYLDRRVDEMVNSGMVEELEEYFENVLEGSHEGLEKAIGVPEFREYFKSPENRRSPAAYVNAVAAIKENTRRLAEIQVSKIRRLGELGFNLKRIDATAAVKAKLVGAGRAAQEVVWERDVLSPSVDAVRWFIQSRRRRMAAAEVVISPVAAAAVARTTPPLAG